MVIDMIHTVAVVTITSGAVTELQLRVLGICSSADRAFVAIGGLRSSLLVVFCPIRIRSLLFAEAALWLAEVGQNVQDVGAKEQKIVQQSEQREETQADHIHDDKSEIEPCQILHLYGDDHQQEHLIFGIDRSEGQQEAQIQIACCGIDAHEERGDIGDHHTTQIEKVESQRAPAALDALADHIVEIHGDGKEEDPAVGGDDDISEQPPDLTVQDGSAVKA